MPKPGHSAGGAGSPKAGELLPGSKNPARGTGGSPPKVKTGSGSGIFKNPKSGKP